jgi:orotate phosphoribosyltransferase
MADYGDLKKAIESIALVRAQSGVRIMRNENSGVRDPWIFDFRALMLQPKWLNRYAEIFWELYKDKLPFQVAGLETAGIPLVAAIVMKSVELRHPVNGFYIRKSRKRQGLMKYIEGTLTKDPVIFVDDLINSGSSVEKQFLVLNDASAKVSDVFVMLAFRDDETYSHLKEKGVNISHLFTLKDFGIPLVESKTTSSEESFEIIWRYTASAPSFDIVVPKSAPILDEENIYFGCDDGHFRALDQKNGNLVWEFKIGRYPDGKAILSSPALHDGVVYFGAYDGNVYALDTKTGKKKWSYERADWIGSSPNIAPDHGLVYVGLEFGLWKKRGGIVALDMKTGAELWRGTHTGTTHGSPLYIKEENLVVVGSNDHVLYAYDAKTGALRWHFASRGEIKTTPAYDPRHREIIFGAMDGTLYGVSALDGTPLHSYEAGVAIYSIPLMHENTIYVSTLDKRVIALDSASWNVRWSFETNGRIFASPAIFESSLWIGANDGKLYELDPQNGKLKSYFQFSERIVNKITYRDGKFFVPTVANEVYCLKRKV